MFYPTENFYLDFFQNLLVLAIFKERPYIYVWSVFTFTIFGSVSFVKLSGDIEENSGPKHNSNQSFSICHWDLNNISALTLATILK